MKGVRKLAVSTFKNQTTLPRVETLVANAVVKQLHQDGTYVVTNSQDADAILTGTVTEVERRPARSVRGNVLQTREFNLYLRVDYKVTDRLSGRVLDSREVSGTTSFFVTGSNNLAADVNQDERQALPIAAEDMAIRLVSQIGEGW
jgi:outer membrane lipopolysaccharide assembly protein LptE/RlpB